MPSPFAFALISVIVILLHTTPVEPILVSFNTESSKEKETVRPPEKTCNRIYSTPNPLWLPAPPPSLPCRLRISTNHTKSVNSLNSYFARFRGSDKSFSITLPSFFQDQSSLHKGNYTGFFVLPWGDSSDISDVNACDSSQSEKDHEGLYPIALSIFRKLSLYRMFRQSPPSSGSDGGGLHDFSGRNPGVRPRLRAFRHSTADRWEAADLEE